MECESLMSYNNNIKNNIWNKVLNVGFCAWLKLSLLWFCNGDLLEIKHCLRLAGDKIRRLIGVKIDDNF